MGDQFAIVISAVLARGISGTSKAANSGVKVCRTRTRTVLPRALSVA